MSLPDPRFQPPQVIHQTIVNAPAQSQALPALVNFFCFPSLGQLIQGRVLAALIWWLLHGAAAASCLIGIGFVLWPIVWIGCVAFAAEAGAAEASAGWSRGSRVAVDAEAFRTADGNLEGTLRIICERVHGFGDVAVKKVSR